MRRFGERFVPIRIRASRVDSLTAVLSILPRTLSHTLFLYLVNKPSSLLGVSLSAKISTNLACIRAWGVPSFAQRLTAWSTHVILPCHVVSTRSVARYLITSNQVSGPLTVAVRPCAQSKTTTAIWARGSDRRSDMPLQNVYVRTALLARECCCSYESGIRAFSCYHREGGREGLG